MTCKIRDCNKLFYKNLILTSHFWWLINVLNSGNQRISFCYFSPSNVWISSRFIKQRITDTSTYLLTFVQTNLWELIYFKWFEVFKISLLLRNSFVNSCCKRLTQQTPFLFCCSCYLAAIFSTHSQKFNCILGFQFHNYKVSGSAPPLVHDKKLKDYNLVDKTSQAEWTRNEHKNNH